ncbi:MAG: restriction endonuclease subunit S [Planctomycetota bacterium]
MKWTAEPLGRLVQPGRSISYGVVQPGQHDPDGVPIVRVTDVRGGRIDTREPLRVARRIEEQHDRTRLRGGELLITIVGTVGETAVVPEEMAGWNVARAIGVVPLRGDIGSRWARYALLSPAAQGFVKDRLNTTVQATLNLRDVGLIPIPLPPQADREAILDVLGSLDDKIDLNRRTCATLEAIVRATFKSWFVDFDPVKAKAAGEPADSICRRLGLTREVLDLFASRLDGGDVGQIPSGWHWATMNDIARCARDGVDPAEVDPATPYIGLEHMPRGSIVLDDWGSAEGLESGKFSFQEGQVLFGKLRPYFKKVGVAPVSGICSTDILVLDPRSPDVWGHLVMHASSTDLIDYASGSSGGTRMPRTSWDDVSRFRLRLPPLELAAAFTQLVRPMATLIREAILANRALAGVRDSLLPRLMTGDSSTFLKAQA